MLKLIMTLLLIVPLAHAEKIRSRIDSVDMGNDGEEALLKLENGRVVFVKDENKFLLEDKSLMGSPVEINTDERGNLESVTSPEFDPDPEQPTTPPTTTSVNATVLPDYNSALIIFRGMNPTWKTKTECTDRAQVWTYEEWKKRGLISRKVFLFFTNTYIRRYRYHWWFHVSPYVLVKDGEVVTERVMDRRYTRGPLFMKSWTDIFIYSKQTCAESTYRHYRQNRNGAAHCFVVKADMYYRLPLHVRNLEDYGQVKTKFSLSEVNFSYRAFRRRGAK
jgi:hypothetical protein